MTGAAAGRRDSGPTSGRSSAPPTAARRPRVAVDVAVWRVVAGYRVVATAWLAVLAALTVTGGGARLAVATAMVSLAAGWTVVAVLLTTRPQTRTSWPFVVADVLVAVAAVAVPTAAAPESGGFAGGYPFAAVLHAAVARGLPGGLVAAVALAAATAVQQGLAPGDVLSRPAVEVVLFYVVSAAVIALAYRELQVREGDRLVAEAALAAERAERVRSDERAETAAALHDSVLQTLALIQRRTDDPEVGRLARSQERSLREWLHGRRPSPDRPHGHGSSGGTAAALRRTADDVEADHAVTVEVVAVGDAVLDGDREALVAAAREAMVNAAVHAGVSHVAVYAELGDGRSVVFVRDRGRGFEPHAVPDDRRGVAESIVGRLARHRGRAEVDTAPGRGTEWTLTLGDQGG